MAGKARARVGVRELRQNLSVYLRRVDAGETLEVTERGRSVALLVPLPRGGSLLERWVASGRVRPPGGDLLETLRGVRRDRSPAGLWDAYDAERAERL
jgi:prevent-host-death family protein